MKSGHAEQCELLDLPDFKAMADQHTARFSLDRVYRYTLTRRWATTGGMCNFLMLNPSTADESKNDPTVTKIVGFAKRWGYAGLVVTNLFAFRATDPKAMMCASEPVGPFNDAAILESAQSAALVVCAWGRNGSFMGRSDVVRRLLQGYDITLHSLALTKAGQPVHPLYQPNSRSPQPWHVA